VCGIAADPTAATVTAACRVRRSNLRSIVAPCATIERRFAGPARRVRAATLVGTALPAVLATLVLLGALAPPVAAASGWGGRPDRWAGAARALAPTPSSAAVQTARVRPWPRWAPAGHGPFTAPAIRPVRRSGVAGAAARPTPIQGTPSPVRRRGPPSPTS
jgi:hypothetical protein